MKDETRKTLAAAAIILSVSAVLAYHYVSQVDLPYQALRINAHNEILSGTALAPYRYRVLVPFLLQPLIEAGAGFLRLEVSFFLVYALFEFLAIFLIQLSIFFLLRHWFSLEQSLIGALFSLAPSLMAFRDHYFQPWSLAETVFVAFGLLAILKRKPLRLGVLVLLAALNRETALLLPLAFLFAEAPFPKGDRTSEPLRKTVLFSFLLLAVWGGVYFSLRALLGHAPLLHEVSFLLQNNLTAAGRAFLNNALFLGAFWVFVLLGFQRAPVFLKKVSLIIPFYLVAVFFYGFWYEVRLLLPVLPVLLPLGLSFLFEPKTATARQPDDD